MPDLEQATAIPAENQRFFTRFTAAQRYMHGVLFSSFLGLAATGLPMRFSQSFWARKFASAVGGFGAIIFFHKLCAIVLTIAFLIHLKDIFTRGIVNREKGIFWGPNSMVANWKDVKDLVMHMRWFVGLGKRPTFGRYAYWEKFDYWAVFWGMLIIGFSGYAMWFAPFFARFMVIFTGVESEEEFKHKRPEEFEALQRQGKLEARTGSAPATWWINFARVIGFTAILIGLTLLVLTLSAYFS